MFLLAQIFSTLISIIIYIIIAQIILFWLIEFEVIKTRSFNALQLRRVVPPLGGIDITPIIVILGLQILQGIIWQVLV
jgi:YggT family protein